MDREDIPSLFERLSSDRYLTPEGYTVFTERFHMSRGFCCGNGCRHCPFEPRAQKNNRHVAAAYLTHQPKGI
ncbi:DUF5522 domain-containing protein [Sulfidibacter corallicola]|uniref:Uncharacterized protein n=1 Tax=Sulfidibacter corallicola TaxID=2818388 RepID=A0A8A4TI21_SULCO|nr:DUF5522 domain-containing protein [Sulfidibacter corallicola]QTD49210.1 hypothetical protein J3U87_26800 [Sulfidibacter corallicola]